MQGRRSMVRRAPGSMSRMHENTKAWPVMVTASTTLSTSSTPEGGSNWRTIGLYDGDTTRSTTQQHAAVSSPCAAGLVGANVMLTNTKAARMPAHRQHVAIAAAFLRARWTVVWSERQA